LHATDGEAIELCALSLHRAGISPSTFFNGLDSVQTIADEIVRELGKIDEEEKAEAEKAKAEKAETEGNGK
jgi:hypothetical protein